MVGKPRRRQSVADWRNAIVSSLNSDGRTEESVLDLNPGFFSSKEPKTSSMRNKLWKNEREFSRACFARIHGDLMERYPDLANAYHVANENSHHEPGVLGGIPDIVVPSSRGPYNCLYVELKVGSNKPSRVQRERIDSLRRGGSKVHVIWDSVEEVVRVIEEYFKETK